MKTFAICLVSAAFLFACQDCPDATTSTQEKDSAQLIVITPQIEYAMNIIDPHESGDWWHENIKEEERVKLLGAITAAVRSGKLTAYYHPLGMPAMEEKYAMSMGDFEAIWLSVDTVIVEDIETGESREVVVETKTGLDEIDLLFFMEEWRLDEKNLQLIKVVNGIAFGRKIYDMDTGDFRGNKVLFWVWLNDIKLLDIDTEPLEM